MQWMEYSVVVGTIPTLDFRTAESLCYWAVHHSTKNSSHAGGKHSTLYIILSSIIIIIIQHVALLCESDTEINQMRSPHNGREEALVPPGVIDRVENHQYCTPSCTYIHTHGTKYVALPLLCAVECSILANVTCGSGVL